MLLLEGKTPARLLRKELRERVAALAAEGHQPRLAAVLVGENRASELYLRRKCKLGRDLGVAVEEHRMATASEQDLITLLQTLSRRPDLDGILVEQPLPAGICKERVLAAIDPCKDVDGRTPATPWAVMRLLHYYGVPLRGSHVVIIGHSDVVGKPLALLMLAQDATVTVCHKATHNLAALTRQADVLVVAAGVPYLVQGHMVRPGATVVDVGINLVNGQTVGDVDFESVAAVAGALTPVPGGVGPMTTLTILANTVANAERAVFATETAAD